MHIRHIMNWCLFPPQTRNLQYDEKWSYVYKKQKNVSIDESLYGNCWDFVAYDPDNKLVVSVVVGKRTKANTYKVVQDAYQRTGGRYMDMLTSDEYKAYQGAILDTYGEVEVSNNKTEESKKVGRPSKPKKIAPEGLNYAVVHKQRDKGKVVNVTLKVIFGNTDKLKNTGNSKVVNTAYIERYNGTDRNQNSRKVRKACTFSKSWFSHMLVTFFVSFSYNFCWAVRTLNPLKSADTKNKVTPAMSANLTDHVWSIKEWLSYPVPN